jgi:GntR family transcriptional regulator
MPDAIVVYLQDYLQSATDARPIYRKLADGLTAALQDRLLQGHGHLPSERILSDELGISRVTLRRAMDELVSTGRLVRRRGARTEVAQRMEKALSKLTGFSEEIRARGMEPGARWLSRSTGAATEAEAGALGLSSGDAVLRLRRVRLADGAPIALERATVPVSILPSGDLVDGSLYEALRRIGAPPVRGLQRIRAGKMTKGDAQLLDSSPGAPLLIVERRCFLEDGRAVEFTETRYNGDSYEFLTELGI